jgi:hypothetical protein
MPHSVMGLRLLVPTGSETITSHTAGAKTTTPTGTGASTESTSKAGVAGMADVVPAGSLLAVLLESLSICRTARWI